MHDDTLAKMFWSRVEQSGDRGAHQSKTGPVWTTRSWREVGDVVREVACGLLALGRRAGEKVAVLSQSRAEWVQADFAIFSIGGVTVPIYPTYPPDLIAYVVNDSQARTLFVEDQTQLVKALEARPKMEGLEHIVVFSGYESGTGGEGVLSWDALRQLGREREASLRAELRARIEATSPSDVATIVYTSGTTGPPKGVVQTHGNHVAALRSGGAATPVQGGWVHLLFLPLAHSFGRMESFLGVYHGLTTAFAESLDKLRENLPEVRPHFICGVPRVYEKVYAGVVAAAESGSPAKRRIFHWALSVGRDVSAHQQRRQPVPVTLEWKRRLAHKLVFSKLHARLGGRLQWAVSGGAPLSREIAEFFHAAGVLVLEGYGLTETCPVLTFNRPGSFKFGSVGQALPGVELAIADDGEILARGPNVATSGYHKQPDTTAQAFDKDGWFHTGDIGHVDADGFLFITDRKKDLLVTAGGMNIAPQNTRS
ncbi:MAG: long-chain fatty acid--CoA ligase [Candidatus Rokuibacteriota bacterium]|nr:MAG: long-chain fatty acid--CoA ligase [Candidatus Rokubacteria bacterium]